MQPISTIAKRIFVAGSLLLLAACSSSGITEPTAQKSGYLTVSAGVSRYPVAVKTDSASTNTTAKSGYNVPANVGVPVQQEPSASGYNVPAN